ncbi:pseudouridylate synthase 7 homolog [Trichonephila clavata]|uniref:Pseudouridylate synthase 7 homolog n=1 Tax=Trichonephila clavata TaxID=2740835 RepID=A0A8X6GGZ3_TRICU|nr:pseudouridylate synthase 7 homolog [Trichonephila clavata]
METEGSLKHLLNDQDLENNSTSNKRLCTEPLGPEKEIIPFNKSSNEIQNDNSALTKPNFTRASENDVGITEYVSNLPGFNAVVKERYSDFIVNEIDTQGNVVKLTDLSKPKNPECDFEVEEGLLDDETMKKLKELVAGEISEVKIEVTDKDKDARKEVHVAIRKMFNKLESSTIDSDSKKYIVVKKFSRSSNRRSQLSVGGNYLHFVLYKENKDTMDAINAIASFLRVSPKPFSYAGSKDKRGKTSQLVSAHKISPEKLLNINKDFNMVRVGNLVYKNEQLKLGDLLGNRFIIILRQLEGDSDIIKKAIASLSTKGFINYYGMQRFGTSSVPTHSIGRLLLCLEWEKVIELILTPKPEDDEELHNAKKVWAETKDAKLALKNRRLKSNIEEKLLKGLASVNKKDYCNAFNAIPRNMRLMYIHSYQSYIWNKIVSKRIKQYGLKVLKGDLVPKESGLLIDDCEDDKEESNRKIILENMVKVISEDEVEKYNISDVLLPLPGHSVVLPNNEIKNWYDDILKEDGMEWNNFDSKIKSLSLSGAYRKIIVIPKDVKWEIIPYDDVTKPLALSDLDILQNVSEPVVPESGRYKALKLEFQLPPSAYATMAIREISKQSTCYMSK